MKTEVMLRLRDSAGAVEDVWAGHLYVKVDAAGVIIDIEIEDQTPELEIYFDSLDSEWPEIPAGARFKRDKFGAWGYGAPAEIDWTDLDPDSSPRTRAHAEKAYAQLRRGAQRLLERVLRGEPVMVGALDLPFHQRHFDGPYAGHLFESPGLTDFEPMRRGPPGRPPKERKDERPEAQRLVRVYLTPVNAAKLDRPLVLDVPLRADGYAARIGRIFGLSTGQGADIPLMIMDDGMVETPSAAVRKRLHATNLFARPIEQDVQVAFWQPGYLKHVAYEITSTTDLIGKAK